MMEAQNMINIKKHKTKLALLIFLTITSIAANSNAQIVCDQFKIVAKLTGDTLDLSLNTDLPDNAVIFITVSRDYLEKGNSAKYSVECFSEKGIVGEWRSKHRISVGNDVWKSALREKQEKMSRLGLGFDVASISDKIEVSMVVAAPKLQTDPRFGTDDRSKITGKALKPRKYGKPWVVDEIEIDYPLDPPPVGKSPFPTLNPLELEAGQTYIVTKQTPLMPSHSPADPIAAIQNMKQIPKGGAFKVLDTFGKRGNPWYRVTAFDQRKKQIGIGWINSTALIGQKLNGYSK
jgi:hypothetical protein